MLNYKTISVAGFISLLTIPLILCITLLIQQQIVKHEMKEALEYAQLETLVLEPEQIIWEKKHKELKINGHFFDIKSIKDSAGKVYITGLYDKAEDDIEAKLAHFPETTSTNHTLIALFNLMHIFIAPAIADTMVDFTIMVDHFKHHSYYLLHASLAVLKFPTPPPRD